MFLCLKNVLFPIPTTLQASATVYPAANRLCACLIFYWLILGRPPLRPYCGADMGSLSPITVETEKERIGKEAGNS